MPWKFPKPQQIDRGNDYRIITKRAECCGDIAEKTGVTEPRNIG